MPRSIQINSLLLPCFLAQGPSIRPPSGSTTTPQQPSDPFTPSQPTPITPSIMPRNPTPPATPSDLPSGAQIQDNITRFSSPLGESMIDLQIYLGAPGRRLAGTNSVIEHARDQGFYYFPRQPGRYYWAPSSSTGNGRGLIFYQGTGPSNPSGTYVHNGTTWEFRTNGQYANMPQWAQAIASLDLLPMQDRVTYTVGGSTTGVRHYLLPSTAQGQGPGLIWRSDGQLYVNGAWTSCPLTNITNHNMPQSYSAFINGTRTTITNPAYSISELRYQYQNNGTTVTGTCAVIGSGNDRRFYEMTSSGIRNLANLRATPNSDGTWIFRGYSVYGREDSIVVHPETGHLICLTHGSYGQPNGEVFIYDGTNHPRGRMLEDRWACIGGFQVASGGQITFNSNVSGSEYDRFNQIPQSFVTNAIRLIRQSRANRNWRPPGS